MLKRFVVCVAFLILATCIVSCNKKSPTVEQVVLYCSVDQAIAEPIIAEFEKLSGIKVLARFDTEASKTVGLVQKIRAEKKRPSADVFWSSELFHTIRLAREGLLTTYNSPETQSWPKTFVDPKRRWYAFALRARVIAYNTLKMSDKQAPESLESILDTKWKNKLVMANPQFGTTGGDVASWFAMLGKEEAEKVLISLKSNSIRIVDGNSTAVRMVANGQAEICLTDTDDVYAGQRNGWPIKMKLLRRANQGTLAIPNSVAIINGCPNRDNAEVLMSFLLGGIAEKMLLESDSHNWPVIPEKMNNIDEFAEYEIEHILKIDYQRIVDNLDVALTCSGEILN